MCNRLPRRPQQAKQSKNIFNHSVHHNRYGHVPLYVRFRWNLIDPVIKPRRQDNVPFIKIITSTHRSAKNDTKLASPSSDQRPTFLQLVLGHRSVSRGTVVGSTKGKPTRCIFPTLPSVGTISTSIMPKKKGQRSDTDSNLPPPPKIILQQPQPSTQSKKIKSLSTITRLLWIYNFCHCRRLRTVAHLTKLRLRTPYPALPGRI